MKAQRIRTLSPAALRVGLAFFLLLSSAAILFTTAESTRSARSLATQSLESTALALSSSAETALRSGGDKMGGEIRQILSDRVVAYALIAGQDGKIQFHTNPRLIGSSLSREDQNWPSETASGRTITLGTGLPAYEFNYILHGLDGVPELLRMVLHTTPADRIVSGAERMWWTVGVVLILLWTVGILFERIFTQHLRLREELEKRHRLALIGQMTAVLAHEIRNALGSIKGYAQWVDEKIEEKDEKKAGLAAVLRGSERIETLVNELLLFSRQETYRLEPIDLPPLIQDLIPLWVSPWQGTVELEIAEKTKVIADREKLERVLGNGLRNAVEAMGEAGTLKVAALPDERWIEIRIEDRGHGIPGKEVPHLFTPFHTTKTGGTGLGLAYSKKVMEGMRGTITLTNRQRGSGAILTLRLPEAGDS
jgi:two-component system, NtrC family, sensor histidine kinase HydH